MKLFSIGCYLIFSTALNPKPSQAPLHVEIKSITGYGEYELFAKAAAKKLEEVVNSEIFRIKLLENNYTWDRDMTNQEIYQSILTAHEIQGPGGNDGTIDLRLRVITREEDGQRWLNNCEPGSGAGTIGIDGKGDGIAAICPQKLRIWSEAKDTASLAGHFMHEYIHLLGFSHPSWGHRRQVRTVVYKIGDIVEDIITNHSKL